MAYSIPLITTNSIPLFAKTGDFHAEAKLTYTIDEKARTFTVKVEGVRGYCKYGWNFTQNIQMWLGTSNKGSDKKSKTGTISNSGSNSYKGWLPKTGYSNISFSKTYDYDDKGNAPQVWFYLRDYNPSVYWINANKRTPVDVSYIANISSNIKTIGPKDDNPPKLELEIDKVDDNYVYWTCKSDSTITKWESNLDTWKFSSSEDSKTISNKTNIGNKNFKLQLKATKKSNKKIGKSNKLTIDNRLPKISNASLIPESANTGRLKFNCDFPIDFRIKAPNKGYIDWYKNCGKSVSKSIPIISNIDDKYTIQVRRTNTSSENWLNSLTDSQNVNCDSIIPEINQPQITAISSTEGILEFTSQVAVDFRIKDKDKSYTKWYTIGKKAVREKIPLTYNKSTDYVLEVRRSGNAWKNELKNSTTLKGDSKLPEIDDINTILKSKNSASLSFTHNNRFTIEYELTHNGSTLISRTITSDKKINKTFNLNGNTYSTKYVLKIYRADNSNLYVTYPLTIDNRLPVIYDFNISPISRNTANLYFKYNDPDYGTKFEGLSFRLTWPNGMQTDWNELNPSHCIYSKDLIVQDNTSGNYILELKRKESDFLSNQQLITCDTRIPSNISFNIYATESNLAMIDFRCELDTVIELIPTDSSSKNYMRYVSGKLTHNELVTLNNIPIIEDSIERYHLKVTHFNNGLYTYSEPKSCDSRIPKIKLYEISSNDISGSEVNLNISSDLYCSEFLVKYLNTASGVAQEKIITMDNHPLNQPFQLTTLRDLEPGDAYEVEVSGKRHVMYDIEHKLIGTSNTQSFIVNGGIYIFGKNNTYNSATIYVCISPKTGGENVYRAVTPYICITKDKNGNPIEPKWQKLK